MADAKALRNMKVMSLVLITQVSCWTLPPAQQHTDISVFCNVYPLTWGSDFINNTDAFQHQPQRNHDYLKVEVITALPFEKPVFKSRARMDCSGGTDAIYQLRFQPFILDVKELLEMTATRWYRTCKIQLSTTSPVKGKVGRITASNAE